MKIIFLLVILNFSLMSGDIEVTITADSVDYHTIYKSNVKRILRITSVYKNNTSEVQFVNIDPYFDVEFQDSDESDMAFCFRLYQYNKINDSTYTHYRLHDIGAFVKIGPGEEYINTGYYDISWPCRSAPPWGNWSFNIRYHANFTKEDNYYLLNSRYTDFSGKEYVEAWTGEIISNTIRINIYKDY